MFKTLPSLRSKAVSSVAMACLVILFFISGSSSVQAQVTAAKPKAKANTTANKDAGAAGESIKVGDSFPSLMLKDQDGKTFDLNQTLKKGPVALVIFRSADW